MLIDRDFLRAALARLTGYLGVGGTLLGTFGQGQTWLQPLFLVLIAAFVTLILLDVFFYVVLRGVPWWEIRRAVRRLVYRLLDMPFIPDVVIGVGRAGSIVGAMIAANMGHRTFIGLDVRYDTSSGGRTPIVDGPLNLRIAELDSKRVLLVFAYVNSGRTAQAAIDYINGSGAKPEDLRYASLFIDPAAHDLRRDSNFYYVSQRRISDARWRGTPWHVHPRYDYQ